jgi:glycosyltransferase involved in cell wall biosynthesis
MTLSTPMVSIVLPTYNRAHLLRQAVDSIQAQTYQSWELIIVDNASSDDTSQVIAEIAANLRQPVRSVILQENQGPSRAFNRGIDEARAPYTAFLCDDDLWLPHHLEDCISALENNRDVDWVFAAMRRVELSTGRVLHPSTFCVDGRPHPFLCLNVQRRGRLCVVDDPNARKGWETSSFLYIGGRYSSGCGLGTLETAKRASSWSKPFMADFDWLI